MKVLIIVDIQNDFCPGGSLPVPDGDKIVPIINKIQDKFDLVVATQDWHPQDHVSFASNHKGKNPFDTIMTNINSSQILWPDHCVQGTKGAELHPDLNTNKISGIFRKGMDVNVDSYSGFYDNNGAHSTGLMGYLKEIREEKASSYRTELYICGLAGDVCVLYTTYDAIDYGYKVFLIEDAIKSINDSYFKEEIRKLNETIDCNLINSNEI